MVMCVSGVYALSKDTEVKGIVSTGAVEIKLETYTTDETGNEVLYTETDKHVMPGNEISLIPKVSNMAENCYLRAKIEIDKDDLCVAKDIPSDWTKRGEYYYLNDVFAKGAQVNVFHTLEFLDTASSDAQNGKIVVTVIVEAIQEKNFEPDYSLEDPWKGEEIEKCIEKSYSVDGDDTDSITVTYRPDSIEVNSEFFDDLEHVMPGDEITGSVKIKNKHSKNSEIFMDIIPDNLDDEADDLLKKLTIIIKDEKQNTIYEGNVYDFEIMSLGKFNSGEEKSLTFVMRIPSELKNSYSKINSNLNWTFFTEDEEEKEEPAKKEEQDYNKPKTGDFKFDISVGVFFISTIGLIIVMFIGFIEKRKNN